MSQLTGASYSPQTKIILHKNTANPNINCIHSNAVVIAERIGWQHFHLKKEFVKKFITGQNGVHLVREISPWSSQVLCIGLAQNLKPILSDDKYWNINPNISAFGM